jgi:ribosomal protein S15P/S13E
MSAEPIPLRRLAPVDLDTGEKVSPEVAMLQERIASLEEALHEAEKDLRVKRGQLTKLKKDVAKERFAYARAEDVRRIHDYWQRRMGHKQALTGDRFDAVRGILEETRLEISDGKAKKQPAFKFPDDFKAAIDGAWLDPYSVKQKNGRLKKFQDLALICRDGKTFQSFIDRAPIREER